MLKGYAGKYLWIDLSRGKIEEKSLDENLCKDYIGGYGIGSRIIFDCQKPGIDPLSDGNILGFVTGPLTGTQAITGNRYQVMAKSPLTGGWGDANSGGDFGPYLKFSGFDAVFFTGASKEPVYLFIKDGKAEIKSAVEIWGKDTFETEKFFKDGFGNNTSVCCIGPAGEKLSLISGIMNNFGRAAARSGLGAVMGSKKLKAISVIGNGKFPIHDENEIKQIRKKYLKQLTDNGLANLLREYGTPVFTGFNTPIGRTPVKNWGGIGEIDFKDIESIGGKEVLATLRKKDGCWHCPITCGGRMKPGKKYDYGEEAAKPEYETVGAFGTMCLNHDLESITKANDICNRFGLDSISTGCVIAFAIECYENGIISNKDTDGIELTWGNSKAIVAMTEKIARREGFGILLGEGVKRAAERIGGKALDYAIHIGGQELPMHDPKFAPSYLVTYKMDATPGRHTQGGAYNNETGMPVGGVDIPALEQHMYREKGEANRVFSAQMHVVNAAGECMFFNLAIGNEPLLEGLNAVTGNNYSFDDLIRIGERIGNLRHAFNLREGINPLKRNIPNKVKGSPAQETGPLKGITIDEEVMLSEFLKAMDWDPVTTRPSDNKLEELGLADIIPQLP